MTQDGAQGRSLPCMAFEELYLRHHGRVLSYIRGQVRDPELAEDLAAEAFLQALRHFHSLRRQEAALAWLLAISRRTVLAHLKRQRRELLCRQRQGSWIPAAADPWQDLEEQELVEALRGAVRSLAPRQRQALALRFWLQLPGPEVARRMGIEAGTARVILCQALRRLRQAVRRYAEAG